MDNFSVNFWGIMVFKGILQVVIDKLVVIVLEMFKNGWVVGKMKVGGSSMYVMIWDEVKVMWVAWEVILKELLVGF